MSDESSCPSCGARPVEGLGGCSQMWDHLLARSFSEFPAGRYHRQIVDAYSLQHPDRFCASAKSFAAHLTGLACHLEHGASNRVYRATRSWLDGPAKIEKPPLPEARGGLTIAHVAAVYDPPLFAQRTEAWLRSVWEAYAGLHDLARSWIESALA